MEYGSKVANRLAPVVVPREEAPVKQVLERGEEVNLFKFPIFTHNYMDPGPYICTGFVTCVDPDTGIDNTSLQRIWVKHPRRTGYWAAVSSHNMQNILKWWKRGQNMPVAIWIGHHPGLLRVDSRAWATPRAITLPWGGSWASPCVWYPLKPSAMS